MLNWITNQTDINSTNAVLLGNTISHSNDTELVGIDTVRFICIALWSIIVIFGLFGNCLTIAVLLGPKLNNTSTTFYLTALAFVDLMYLIFSVGSQIYNSAFFVKIRQMHVLLCMSVSIVCYSLTYISVWLLVSVAIDRMIWVIFPFSAKVICTRNIAKLIVMFLGLFFICVDLHFIWTLEYVQIGNYSTACHIKSNTNFRKIFPVLDLILIMGLPFLIMFTANILIITKWRQMERFRKRMKSKNIEKKQQNLIEVNNYNENSGGCEIDEADDTRLEAVKSREAGKSSDKMKFDKSKRSTRRMSRDKQTASLTKMLLSVNIFFLISTTPLLIYNLVFFIIDSSSIQPSAIIFIFTVEKFAYTLWYLNFAVHFLLYCMSGPKFRQEAIRLLNSFCCLFQYLTNNPQTNLQSNNVKLNKSVMNETQYLKTVGDGVMEENKYFQENQ